MALFQPYFVLCLTTLFKVLEVVFLVGKVVMFTLTIVGQIWSQGILSFRWKSNSNSHY